MPNTPKKMEGTSESVCNDCFDAGFKGAPCPHIKLTTPKKEGLDELVRDLCAVNNLYRVKSKVRRKLQEFLKSKAEDAAEKIGELRGVWIDTKDQKDGTVEVEEYISKKSAQSIVREIL